MAEVVGVDGRLGRHCCFLRSVRYFTGCINTTIVRLNLHKRTEPICSESVFLFAVIKGFKFNTINKYQVWQVDMSSSIERLDKVYSQLMSFSPFGKSIISGGRGSRGTNGNAQRTPRKEERVVVVHAPGT